MHTHTGADVDRERGNSSTMKSLFEESSKELSKNSMNFVLCYFFFKNLICGFFHRIVLVVRALDVTISVGFQNSFKNIPQLFELEFLCVLKCTFDMVTSHLATMFCLPSDVLPHRV